MTKTLNVAGMTCMHCASAVIKALERIDGVTKATVDLKNKTATVEIGDKNITDETFRAAVEDAGFAMK